MNKKNKEFEPRKNTFSRIKNFLVGTAIATLGIGGVHAVKVVEKEQQAKEWKAMNADADSIHIDTEKGEFYAEKKSDNALDAAKAKLDTLLKQRQVLVDKANNDFIKAFDNRNAEEMKKAIANHADNLNNKNAQGLTPLMVLLKESGSSKSYLCARALIPYADVRVQDNDGASAVEYAATLQSVKGEVLKRDIENRKKQQEKEKESERMESYERYSPPMRRHGGPGNSILPPTYDSLTRDIKETQFLIETLKEYGGAYRIKVNKEGYEISSNGYVEHGGKQSYSYIGIRKERHVKDMDNDRPPSKVVQARKFAREHIK